MKQFDISQKVPSALVCFAVKEEAAPFRQFVRRHPSVRILITGIGEKNAKKALEDVFRQYTPSLVLTCGFAGGLDPDLALGTVVYEADLTTGLAEDMERLGALRARFYCSSRIAITRDEKRSLRETTGADVVEMESEHIRSFCRERSIPSAAVRVISDTANEDLALDFNKLMTPDANMSYLRIGRALLKSPGSVPRLLAMRRQTLYAADKLTHVLCGLLQPRFP